jgi:hypothetical protein
MGALSLDLGFEAAVSLTRPRFVLRGLTSPVYVVPAWAPSAILGLAMQI